MKNLGIITHNFPLSLKDRQNAGIFVGDIAQELAKKHKISVFCPADGKRSKKIGKVRITNFPVLKGKTLGDYKFWNPIDIVRLFVYFVEGLFNTSKFVRGEKIDINIVMWVFPSGVFAYFAKKMFKVPYVVWCLGSDIYVYGRMPILKNIVSLILKSADVVCADGIDLAREATKLSGVKCKFVPSASKAVFKRGKKVARKKGKIVIGFVARMEKVKGPDVLIDALVQIKKNISKYEVHIVGGGSLLEELKQKTKDLEISDYITFYGNVSNFQRVSDVIRRSDWLIIPSRSDSIPLVFSEAMKCNTPVIVSDLPDLKYLINHYKVGLVFKKGSSIALARIIKRLDKLGRKRRMFSINTQKPALDFSIEESAKKLLEYIN